MSESAPGPHDVTALLGAVRERAPGAADRLFPLVYGELRSLASAWFKRRPSDDTLQPTALVHEAWLKLAAPTSLDARDRAHFFALAARAMRLVLLDHARARHRDKRDGGRTKVELDDVVQGSTGLDCVDLMALDEALVRLAAHSEQQARIVELLYFAGLTGDQAAEALDVSPSTVDRQWRFARAWLVRELGGADA